MTNMETEEKRLIRSKQIFKECSDRNAYLICTENPKFHEQNDVQGTKVSQLLKEKLTNITFCGRK